MRRGNSLICDRCGYERLSDIRCSSWFRGCRGQHPRASVLREDVKRRTINAAFIELHLAAPDPGSCTCPTRRQEALSPIVHTSRCVSWLIAGRRATRPNPSSTSASRRPGGRCRTNTRRQAVSGPASRPVGRSPLSTDRPTSLFQARQGTAPAKHLGQRPGVRLAANCHATPPIRQRAGESGRRCWSVD